MTEWFELAPSQREVYLGSLAATEEGLYTTVELLRLPPEADDDRLCESIEAVYRRVDAYHVQIRSEDGKLLQRVVDPDVRPGAVVRLGDRPVQDAIAQARSIVFDPYAGPLVTGFVGRDPDGLYWLHCADHIAQDAYAVGLVLSAVAKRYRDGDAGKERAFGSFVDLVRRGCRYESSEAGAADAQYWTNVLPELVESARFPHHNRGVTRAANRAHATVDGDLVTALDASAKAFDASFVDGLLTACALVASRYCGENRLSLGVPMMNRMRNGSADVPSNWMNVVPVGTTLSSHALIGPSIRSLAEQVRGARDHSQLRLETVLRSNQTDILKLTDLMTCVVNIIPFEFTPSFGTTTPPVARNICAGPIAMPTFTFRRRGKNWELEVDDSGRGFDTADLDLILSSVQRAIAGLAESEWSETMLGTIDVLGVNHTVLGASGSAPRADLRRTSPGESDVVTLLASIAGTHPDRIALVEKNGEQWSWDRLWRSAASLATTLRDAGVGIEDRVLLAHAPDGGSVAAQLGILIAGAAFVPVDPNAPTNRLEIIVADTAAKVIVTDSTGPTDFGWEERGLLVLEHTANDLIAPALEPSRFVSPPAGSSSRLAYTIFTSGTTGSPKGVDISVENLTTFAHAAVSAYGIGVGDRVLQFCALHFDASIEEIYGALVGGAVLVMRGARPDNGAAALAAECERQRISVLDLPTAYWATLTSELAQEPTSALPDSVRAVVLGGEALPESALTDWTELASRRTHPINLVNSYGPTETTVVATSATNCYSYPTDYLNRIQEHRR
ncbi:AMP-binding protein [Rhodococcus sp. NPDC058521]|uniref:AMP-binding protein n=1 Tax=Rhodococcus sp. NPDC058521 TaxID=3346536 RepID=UPI0036469711